MKSKTYSLCQCCVAYILLFSFFLQGCNNFSNLPLARKEDRDQQSRRNNNPTTTTHSFTKKQEGKKLIARDGHGVTLYQEGEELRATVDENSPEGFSRQLNLPVYVEKGVIPTNIAQLSEKRQQQMVEVNLPRVNQVGYVYIGKRGLMGGMEDKKRGNVASQGEKKSERGKIIVRGKKKKVTIAKDTTTSAHDSGFSEATLQSNRPNSIIDEKKSKKGKITESVKEQKINTTKDVATSTHDREPSEAALQPNQPSSISIDLLRYMQTFSMTQGLHSGLQHLFNPSHSFPEGSKLEIEASQILDNISNPISPISQLFESVNLPTIGSSSLKSSESSTIEKLMWAAMQYQFPQYFSDLLLSDEKSESSEVLLPAFIKIFQKFTQGQNSPLELWANQIKEKIQKEEPESDKKMALIEFVEAGEQLLKYMGSGDINNPLKNPLNKYVQEEVKEAISLRSWLKSNQKAKDYDKECQRLEEIKEKIRKGQEQVMEETSVWMLNLLKHMNPAIPASINNLSEHTAYQEKAFKEKKQKEFLSFLRKYKDNQVSNPFESNHLRIFWEEVAREDYGTILYQIICESFQENYKDSEPHKIIKQIWILSQLDTIHEQPQEARSRMPNSSIDGKPALNFGYNMGSSLGYLTWIQQPLIRSVGDITVDAFYSILDFGIKLNIKEFLSHLSFHVQTFADEKARDNYYLDAHPYNGFMHSFEKFLLKHVYKQPFIPGKGLRVLQEFDQKDLIQRSLNALKAFQKFCKDCKDRIKGFVLGVGFNGRSFNAPVSSVKDDKDEIWLTFSESGRSLSGYLFLELMKDIMQNGADSPSCSTPVRLEELYCKYKSLIRLHVDQKIKYYKEDTPDCFEFDRKMLNYTKSQQTKFESFKSQLEQGTDFKDLFPEFKEWLEENNFSNWYRIAASDINIPDELTNEDNRVHSEARSIVFDAIVGKFSLSNYPYLINDLFIHWKREVLVNIDEASKKEIASAENFDNVPERLKDLTVRVLETLINQVHPALKDVWMPEIKEKFQVFMEENKESIIKKIEEAKQSIIRSGNNNVNNRASNPRNRGWEKPEISQQRQESIDKKKQQELESAKRQKESLEQLMQHKIPANLPSEYYQAFKNSFFDKREISQCIEPVFSKVLGHDRFLSILISNESEPERRKNLLILGNGKPQRVIEPCDQRCQFHVLGHLYTGDMLFHQSVDQLDNIRKSHNLGEVPDRFMTLGHKNTSSQLKGSANPRDSSQSTIGIDTKPATWDASTIAKELWKNPKAERHIDENKVKNVNSASTYLAQHSYQLEGVKSDGNCFFSAFLGSYSTLSTKITELDEAPNQISYLRSKAANLYQGKQDRAKEIRQDSRRINSDEGGLLAKGLNIPIRVLNASGGSINPDADDILIFSDKGGQVWKAIPDSEKPQEYIFIVDVGHHFLWAKRKNSEDVFAPSNRSRSVRPGEPFSPNSSTTTPRGGSQTQGGHRPGANQNTQKHTSKDPKSSSYPSSKSTANVRPSEWSESAIAEYFWENPDTNIGQDRVANVNLASQYLATQGYQLEGAEADGGCFFSAFLGSYDTLERKISLLDTSANRKTFLRETASNQYLSSSRDSKHSNDTERADQINRNGERVNIGEGSLLAKALNIPIRVVIANSEMLGSTVGDVLISPEQSKANQTWTILTEVEKPKEYIFIVDVGHHFLWAKRKNSEDSFTTSNRSESVKLEGPLPPNSSTTTTRGGSQTQGGHRPGANQNTQKHTSKDPKSSSYPSSKSTANVRPSEWNEAAMATYLWKDTDTLRQFSEETISKVKLVSDYLEELGYQLEGAKADGNCFFYAFLSSYDALFPTSIPLLDMEQNKTSYLRSVVASFFRDSRETRSKQIEQNGELVTGIEGEKLAKHFRFPIRMVTVNKNQSHIIIKDILTFPEPDKDSQEWDTISNNEKPQDFIFIVDVGGHFLWAKKK